ncbi:hypothetical protein [Paractinoplanes toevensis]|uniref:Uncharacterized protein n=1 Tax=Paractinoplanes toevensis TaxID=571911 RepID=A0A919TDR4_9ACTN|nr:hypothetical protein [Actinoplanes toevensis]GIM93222.1 hypothetical protein Ato02nite_050150 [Actinoplanes toevensis]
MSQRLYNRSSRTIAVADVPPDVLAAIEAHAAERLLDPITETAVACVATLSKSLRKPGLFARLGGRMPEAEHQTFAVLIPTTLVVATAGDQRGITVLSTRLADVDLVGQTDPAYAVDSSIHVRGRWGGPDVGSYVVALGDDPAGQAFHAALRTAVAAAKRS